MGRQERGGRWSPLKWVSREKVWTSERPYRSEMQVRCYTCSSVRMLGTAGEKDLISRPLDQLRVHIDGRNNRCVSEWAGERTALFSVVLCLHLDHTSPQQCHLSTAHCSSSTPTYASLGAVHSHQLKSTRCTEQHSLGLCERPVRLRSLVSSHPRTPKNAYDAPVS